MKLVWVVSASCLPNVVLYRTSIFGNVNDVLYQYINLYNVYIYVRGRQLCREKPCTSVCGKYIRVPGSPEELVQCSAAKVWSSGSDGSASAAGFVLSQQDALSGFVRLEGAAIASSGNIVST